MDQHGWEENILYGRNWRSKLMGGTRKRLFSTIWNWRRQMLCRDLCWNWRYDACWKTPSSNRDANFATQILNISR
jgi:hypothetical protein